MFTGSIKISELDALTFLVDADFFPLVQSGSLTTYRVNLTTLNNWFRVSGSVLSASWASRSLDATRATSASWASASLTSLQTISASWASSSISSSYARSASRSEQTLSSSFANVAISASYAPFSQAFQASSSWASQSLSSSYAVSASYAPAIGDTVPLGTIMAFAGTVAPNNWLECNGDALLTSSFINLYAAIGNTEPSSSYGFLCDSFGNRNAAGAYFKLPDLRGEFARGWDHNRGLDTNRLFGSIQTASLGTHYHGVGAFSSTGNDDCAFIQRTWNDGTSYTGRYVYGNANVNGQTPLNNPDNAVATSGPVNVGDVRPRNVAVMYCIKYSNAVNFATTGSTIAGDVTGTLENSTVVKLRNIPITSSAPTDGDILLYDSASNVWYGGSPNIGGAPGKSYIVANPGAIYGDGTRGQIYVYNYDRHSGRRQLCKINLATNVVNHVIQWTEDTWDHNGRIFRKTTDNQLHILTGGNGDLYDLDLSSNTLVRLTGSSGISHLSLPVKVSWFSGSLRPTIWSLYGGYSAGGQGDWPTVQWIKTRWNGSSWNHTFVGTNLDLRNVQNNTELRKFYAYSTNPNNASNTMLWDYNYIKKRYYLTDTSTGYMHIFSQDVGDIDTNWDTASISYVKTLAISTPSVDNWQDADTEKYMVDYDPDTGQERGICHVRRGNTSLHGVAVYIYWPEND